MNCWHCKTELIWGGDHDCEDDDEFIMVTNLSCSTCNSMVFVYLPDEGGGSCDDEDGTDIHKVAVLGGEDA